MSLYARILCATTWSYLYRSLTKGSNSIADIASDLVVTGARRRGIKALERLTPVHEAQRLTYLRMGGWNAGRLINFSDPLMREGILRRVLGLEE